MSELEQFVPLQRLNAILVPSGDQVGSRSLDPLVSCVRAVPSEFITQIENGYGDVDAWAAKAILLPSGDQAGSMSYDPGGLMMVSPVPSGLIVWMLTLV